jgi:hypothetical protein
LSVELFGKVGCNKILKSIVINSRCLGQDASEVAQIVLVSVIFTGQKLGDFLLDRVFHSWVFPKGEQEHRVKMGQDSDGSDRGVLLFVHEEIYCRDHQLREYLDDELGLEAFG